MKGVRSTPASSLGQNPVFSTPPPSVAVDPGPGVELETPMGSMVCQGVVAPLRKGRGISGP